MVNGGNAAYQGEHRRSQYDLNQNKENNSQYYNKDVPHQSNRGISFGESQSFPIKNASIGGDEKFKTNIGKIIRIQAALRGH